MFPESSHCAPFVPSVAAIHLGPLTKCKSTRWKWQRLPLAFTLKHFAATAGRGKGVASSEWGKGLHCLQRHRVANLQHLWHRQRCRCCLTAWRALGVQRFDQEPGDKPGALWLSSGLFSAAAFPTAAASPPSPSFFGLLPTATPHISALRSRPHLPASQCGSLGWACGTGAHNATQCRAWQSTRIGKNRAHFKAPN